VLDAKFEFLKIMRPQGKKRGATLVQSVKKTEKTIINRDFERLNERFFDQSCDSAIVAGLEIPSSDLPSSTTDCEMAMLPLQLRGLKDIFTAFLSVYRIMRARNMQTSLKSMKERVECVSKRRFEEKELYQLKTLVPDLLQLEKVDENILIKVSRNKGRDPMVCFKNALLQFMPMQNDSETTEVPMWQHSKDMSVIEKRPDFQSPRKKKQRRLSILCSEKQAKASDDVSISGRMGEDLLGSLPRELRRRSLDGIISIESLHKLDQNEKEHRRLSGSEAQLQRHKRATISSLPDIFQRVQAIFGRKGPKVLSLDTVCERIRSGGLETVSKRDIIARVRCLGKHVPEYLVLERKVGGVEDVWITRDKTVDYTDIMNRLMAMQRRSIKNDEDHNDASNYRCKF